MGEREDGIEGESEGERGKFWGEENARWDSLHTTVPANLLRNKLTSVFHIKAPK